MIISNKRSITFLVLFLLVISFLLYHSTITFLPSFVHAWTQSERYAISLQFLQNGFDLFHPATFNLQTVEGVTRIDFPINEYIVAILMKLFGTTSPVVFRSYTLTVSITGLIFLYRFSKRVTASEIKSWLIVLFVFLSPVYTYYQAGFIPCVPAISFIFIAYYFFYEYKLTETRKYFYLSLLFFLLAALIRVPFFILLFAILIQQLFMYFQNKKILVYEVIGFLSVFAIFIAYYRYNIHIGIIYGNMFLDTFLPAKNLAEFKEILGRIYHYWLLQYYTLWHYLLLLVSMAAAFIGIVIRKKMEVQHKALWFNLLIVGSGAILYFLLMTCQYYDHDYYFLDSLFIPVILLFVLSIHYIPAGKIIGKIILFVFLVVVFYMFRDSKKNQEERYTTEPWDRVEMSRKNFMGSEKYLDSIGIPKKAKMLVIDSYSTNIPLFLMNRKGYTVYQTVRDNAALALFRPNWDYVVIQDAFLFSDVLKYYPVVSSVIEPVAGNGKITVYKRSPKIIHKELKEFLAMDKKKIIYQLKTTFDGPLGNHISGAYNIRNSPVFKSNTAVLDPLTEYGASFKITANELKNLKDLKVYVSSDILRSSLGDIHMVAAITNGDKIIYYQGYKLNDYYHSAGVIQKTEFQFVLPEFSDPKDVLSIYLWNPSKSDLLYDDLEVIIYK